MNPGGRMDDYHIMRAVKMVVGGAFAVALLFGPIPAVIAELPNALFSDGSSEKLIDPPEGSENGLFGLTVAAGEKIFAGLTPGDQTSNQDSSGSQSQSAPEAQSYPVATSAESTAPMDGTTPFLIGAGIALAGAATGGSILLSRKFSDRAHDRKKAQKLLDDERDRKRKALTGRFERARKSHSRVTDAYSSYLFDISTILAKPALKDVSQPETAEFYELFSLLGAPPESLEECRYELDRYEQLCARLSRSWEAAYSRATRLGAASYTSEEQKKIRRAMDLLRMAEDPAASDFERASAYRQVRKLIDGLIDVPAETYQALESRIFLMIEPAEPSPSPICN